MSVCFTGAVRGYLIVIGAVWLLLWLLADRWWPATILAFGPRWIYGLPLVVLVPMAAGGRRSFRLAWQRSLL